MKLIFSCYFITQVCGLVIIKSNETEQIIPSMKYSRAMGDFKDIDCDVEAEGIYTGEADLCHESSMNAEVWDKIVLVEAIDGYDCYEEVIYQNLERLGALAVINFDTVSAGSRINKFNLGQKKNIGSIPLLDLGNNYQQSLSSVGNITVEIQGCEEDNPFEACYRPVISVLDVPLVILNAYLAVFTFSARNKLKISEGTNPRRFILGFQGIYFIITATRYFLGLGGYNSYFWAVGPIPIGIAYIGLMPIIAMSCHFPVLSASYWFFLQRQMSSQFAKGNSGCCNKLAQTSFFKSLEFHISNILLAIGSGFCVVSYSRPHPNSTFVGMIVVLYTNLTFLVFSISNYRFNKTMALFCQNSVSKKPSRWELLTGRALESAMKDTQNLTASTLTTLSLQYHLGKWLQIGFGSNLLLTFAIGFYSTKLSINGAASDSFIIQNCIFLLPLFGVGVGKGLISLAFVQGIKGPAKIPSDKKLQSSAQATKAIANDAETHL